VTTPGPLAEEAARLVEALSDWTRGHTGEWPAAMAEHVGGGAECRLCPFCQAIGLLRQARPETFGHLVEASTALAAAVRSLLDAPPGRNHGQRVERIVLDDEQAAPS
jgi:hypothetical protein